MRLTPVHPGLWDTGWVVVLGGGSSTVGFVVEIFSEGRRSGFRPRVGGRVSRYWFCPVNYYVGNIQSNIIQAFRRRTFRSGSRCIGGYCSLLSVSLCKMSSNSCLIGGNCSPLVVWLCMASSASCIGRGSNLDLHPHVPVIKNDWMK